MYYTKNIIFVLSLYLILINSLAYSVPAPPSGDISPARKPILFKKRSNYDNCPAKTVTCTTTVTDTCTKTVTDTCTTTETTTKFRSTTTTCKITLPPATVTKTCTTTITPPAKTVISVDTATNTVTHENTKTDTDTVTDEKTKTNTVINEKTKTNTVINEKTKTNTVINEKTKTNTVIDEKTKTGTVTSKETKTTTLPPQTITVTDVITKSVTDTVTNTVTTTTTVLPCNKPVPDTPCDSPMFAFVSPESEQVLKENKNYDVKYNITKLPGDQSGFVKDLQFYLVSSDLQCINQTIAQNADTTPTRVCNKSLQYTISACANVPPAYYAIQVMYNFCNSTSGEDVCVFHECKRGVVVK